MGSELRQAFSVIRKAPELISPAAPTPQEFKKLSDIDDQEGLKFHVPSLFFYKNSPSPAFEGKDPVKVIREALSKALVFYYPLAGRLREGENRKLLVDCNGEGILFTEADANVKLEHFGDEIQVPCPYLDQLLYNVPGSDGTLGCPLLLIQVTRLRCGGFILGLRFIHTICDGFGFEQFLKAVEEMTNGANSPSLTPVWQREILNARDPPRITRIHHEFEPVKNSRDIFLNMNLDDMAHKSFYFGPKEIASLRHQLPFHLQNCSTFELITAWLWRCRTIALKPDPDEIVRLSFTASARGKRYNQLIPPGYYGNAFVYPALCSKADDLCRKPLEYAVELVKKAKAEINEEYVRSVADLMVIRGRPKYTSEGYFIVSLIILGLGLMRIDLGWGKASVWWNRWGFINHQFLFEVPKERWRDWNYGTNMLAIVNYGEVSRRNEEND
ncbi:hypothetical protein Patl1_29412 [Pistacia atlantica]|uniref:Uncharacterized protein n=1 Tax=Pistacia atlantica TaxID=434234 RepID=A0ACC1AB77_9ROSI|nr:hypothetical protein Patl1_29412 [Pistacia atlantica]